MKALPLFPAPFPARGEWRLRVMAAVVTAALFVVYPVMRRLAPEMPEYLVRAVDGVVPMPRAEPAFGGQGRPQAAGAFGGTWGVDMFPASRETPALQRGGLPRDFGLDEDAQAWMPFSVASGGLMEEFEGGPVFAPTDVDVPPQPMSQEMPVYPLRARLLGIEGRVELMLVVAADGRVAKVTVTYSCPPGVFDEAAVEAVSRWTYKPGRRGRLAVATGVRLPMKFTLKGRETF